MKLCPDLNAFISAAIGAPVYPEPAPHGSGKEYFTYSRMEAVPDYSYSGQGSLWESRYAFYCLSPSLQTANEMAESIADALKPLSRGGQIGTHRVFTVRLEDLVHVFEKETELHRVALNYEISYQED